MSFVTMNARAMKTTTVVSSVVSRETRARRVVRARASEDEAENSAAYRSNEKPELDGVLGKLVSNLPDGRRDSAPESYGSRPESKTLKEGRYARGDPIRSGGVREDTVRGEDFTVVESEGPSVTTLVTLAVGAAVLFGVYKVVELLGEEPVQKSPSSARMPATDKPVVAKTASAIEPATAESSATPTEADSLRAPAPALEE